MLINSQIYFLILLLPFLGSISAGIFGWFIGQNGARLITLFCMSIAFLLSLCFFCEYSLHFTINNSEEILYLKLFNWFNTENFPVDWGFLIDNLTSTMLIVVTGISLLVHWYSCFYMQGDPHIPRFMSYLSLFTFFMIILVTADNLVVLFVGWEGIGLCSYLLISFWFTRIQAVKSAVKALLVNRISDLAFMLGVISCFILFQTSNFSLIFLAVPYMNDLYFNFYGLSINVIDLTCLFLFFGAVGKSAQIGLHTWLPDAMEGPTPVSALIHAATMVTAGVFLIIRCSSLFEYSPSILNFIIFLGALTIFLGASIGTVQNDLKKVIAYSTCSQLGYMILACGLSNYSAALFHLTNHAFFKALLFLAAGSIIHSLNNEQDMRRMGGLALILPFTFAVMTIGTFALQGVPFLSGFYSKDLIIEIALVNYTFSGLFGFWMASLSVALTLWYSLRLISLTFLEQTQAYKRVLINSHEDFSLSIPLFVLAICSIFVGYFLKDAMIGLGSDFLSLSVINNFNNISIVNSEFLHWTYKYLPFIYNYIFLIIFSYTTKLNWINPLLNEIENFLINKWYFNEIYNTLNSKVLIFSYKLFETFDKNVIEYFFISNHLNKIWNISSITYIRENKIYNINKVYLDAFTANIEYKITKNG